MTCHRIECVEIEKALKEALNAFRIRTAQTAELNQLRRDLEHQLAESQAREQVLRNALESYCGDKCNAEYNPCGARNALNQPSDNSALREWGAKLLEKSYNNCECLSDLMDKAAELRGGK